MSLIHLYIPLNKLQKKVLNGLFFLCSYPLKAPSDNPLTNCFEIIKKKTIMGIEAVVNIAKIRPQLV